MSASGGSRVREVLRQFNPEKLSLVRERSEAQGVSQQPWFIVGMSDGMGLRVALAALQSGILKKGVGVYYEPPILLEVEEDGTPISPVHFARQQNAKAVAEFANEQGADFEVIAADCVIANSPLLDKPLAGELTEKIEKCRQASAVPDLILIDSIAFSRWICPPEGVEPMKNIPSLDFEGRIHLQSMKPYRPEKYNETLNSMGRNHGALLRVALSRGWLGPRSVSTFPTWAGGSQEIRAIRGVYGGAVLGDAKTLAENELTQFRARNPAAEVGYHAVIRYPAFLSAALFGIPGGGLLGMVERKVLEEKGLYLGMEELAERTLLELFGPHWVKSNLLAQIQLDAAEITYLDEIALRLGKLFKRIQSYLEARPDSPLPLPEEASRELLEGFVPANYRDLLAVYRNPM